MEIEGIQEFSWIIYYLIRLTYTLLGYGFTWYFVLNTEMSEIDDNDIIFFGY